MRTRLRLGAVSAVGLGALLLATVLASPALAWHSVVTVHAECDGDKVRVDYTVKAWEEGHEATVEVFYLLNGERTDLPSGAFGPAEGQDEFSGSFEVDAGVADHVVVVAVAHWKDEKKPTKNHGKADIPDKCEKETTTTTSTTTTTTTLPEVTTTTEAAVGGETSTTAAPGQLPFTGASSGPMLLAGIGLVGGGLLVLWSSRTRDRHAAR